MGDQREQLMLQALQEYWNHASDMAYVKDLRGVYLCASQPFAASVGLEKAAELVGKTDEDIYSDAALARRCRDDDRRLLETGTPLEGCVEPFTVRGGTRYRVTSKYILRGADGAPCGIIGISRDVTWEHEARQRYESELRSLLALPEDGLLAVLFDLSDWRVADARFRGGDNDVGARFHLADEYFAAILPAVVDDEEVRAFFSQISPQGLRQRYENGERSFALEYRRRLPELGERWVRDEFRFLSDPVTGGLSVVVTLRDIDADKRQYSQLLQAAERDPMTQLLNRGAIRVQAEQYLAHEGRGKLHALFMIDLDNFKLINDSFGHQHGDRVLQDAAKTIRTVFRTADLVGRMGGDEFIALMKDADSEENARRKAAALVAGLQLSVRGQKLELDLTASVGFTLFRGGEADFGALYNEADTALYQSKEYGKNRYSMFGDKDAVFPAEGEDEAQNVDTVHLRTLLDYMDGGVLLAEVGDEIRVTYVSPSTYRTFGRIPEELERDGLSIFSVVCKEDLPGLQEALRTSARDNRLLDYSYRVHVGDSIEWRHIRAKRIPRRGGSVRRMVAVITDITPIKRVEEHLRETEVRYRSAVEQTDALLWEVELSTHTMRLTSPAWTQYGERATVFYNAPESYLREGRVHPDSVEECRRLFSDIYAGREGQVYFLRGYDRNGEDIWIKDQFRLLRGEDGVPYCALCTAQPVPNVRADMARFEQEGRFAEAVRDSVLGFLSANLTRDRLESTSVSNDPRYAGVNGVAYEQFCALACKQTVAEEDRALFSRQIARKCLMSRFQEGESWKFIDYRRLDGNGAACWTSLFIKLMRHPISGDIYAFGYLRSNEAQHRREEALGMKLRRNFSLLLYSRESMALLGRHAFATCDRDCYISISVLELVGLEQLGGDGGAPELSELLFTFGRICRLAVSGDVLIGQLDETKIALLRTDAVSSETQYERVSGTVKLLKEMMEQTYPGAKLSLVSGFAVEQAGKSSYDALLRQAALACRSVSRTVGDSTAAYSDTGLETAEGDDSDLSKRYQALELRYQQAMKLLRFNEIDDLTGLPGKQAFFRRVRKALDAEDCGARIIVRMDINRFKVYNDVRGTAAGDQLLRAMGAQLRKFAPPILCGRLESDHFVLFTPDSPELVERSWQTLRKWLADYSPDYRLSVSVGVYRITDPSIDVSLMCDRALLALRSAKGGFETSLAYYDETLRGKLLEEQLLVDDMDSALRGEQFAVYFQPQIDYETGALIGAEALVRWEHPVKGLLSPAAFIPLFEKNGLITRLDEYMWDRCCRYIRAWADENPGMTPMPISVNVSRLDIYDPKLCATLLGILRKYGLSPAALRLEITEGVYMENPQQLIATVRELQAAGFLVEMDDFGSGYSSLNTLKDVPVDILKLDMKFLSESEDSARGGNILSSIIRMAHWLKLPVIAEGVETKAQADYLKSLSCLYMQGFYFDRPLPASQFEQLLKARAFTPSDRFGSVDLEGAAAFWDPSAQTALLFNSFVGGAAILEYENGHLAVVRANDRFYQELGAARSDYLENQQHMQDRFDEKNRTLYLAMLKTALHTGDEAECEVQSLPLRPGGEAFWTHNRVRLLAKNGDAYLFYLAVENTTKRRTLEEERATESERSHLLMKTTGTCFVDYDYARDSLYYQVYRADKGIEKRTVYHCRDSLFRSPLLDDASAAALREAIFGAAHTAEPEGELELLGDFWGAGPRWYRLRYVRLWDESGQAVRLVGQTDDIHESKERQALAEVFRNRLNAKPYGQNYNDVIVNQVFGLFYESSDLTRAIETTLSLLGEYFALSRAYILEDSPDHSALSNTFEWCAVGVTPQIHRLQRMPYADRGGREQYLRLFSDSGAFFAPDLHALPPKTRAELEAQDIKSLLQCAVRDNGTFTGVVGFDECRADRHWTDEQIGTLLFVSRIIASFLMKLRQSDSAAFSADFRAALDDNAAYLYLIDPDTHEIIYSNRAIQREYGGDCVGQICYRAFVGRESPCENCPARQLHDPRQPHIAEILRADGMLVLSQASPLRWGGRDMAMLSCADVTKSRRAEQALLTEKKKTDLALAASDLALWTYNIRDNSFTISSGGARRYHVPEYLSGAWERVLSDGLVLPDSTAAYAALHQRLLRGDSTASAVIHFDPARYAAEWLKITYTTVFDTAGAPESAIAIGEDVTAQRKAEERYRQEAEFRRTLGRDSLLTLRINVTRDTVEDVQAAKELRIQPTSGMRRDELVPAFAANVPDAVERQDFLSFFSAKNLLDAYGKGETELHFTFRAMLPDGRRRFLAADLRLMSQPGSGDVIAFAAMRDQTEPLLMERIMKTVADTSYDYIAYIDALTGHFRLFAASAANGVLPEQGGDFAAAAAAVLQRCASAPERERVLRETALPRVTETLKQQTTCVCVYRSSPETGGRLRQLVFRPIGADLGQLLLTRQDVTELSDPPETGGAPRAVPQ